MDYPLLTYEILGAIIILNRKYRVNYLLFEKSSNHLPQIKFIHLCLRKNLNEVI